MTVRILSSITRSRTPWLLFTATAAFAQYQPPSPPGPAPGALDHYLVAEHPALHGWDFGLNERLRYEDKSGAGTTHAGANYDFASAPPTTNQNSYWLSRLMPRVGYADDWCAATIELRSSYSLGDNRYTATAPGRNLGENDGPLQVQLANLAIGNLKQFPLTVKVGRQELNFGDQRLVGAAMWLNIPHTFDAIKVRYQDSTVGVDLFAADLVYVRQDHFEESNSQDRLSGAYFDFPGLSKTDVVELYLLARNVRRGIVTDDWSLVPAPFRMTAPQDTYTVGYHAKSKPGARGPWDYGIEAMYQFGNRTAVFPGTSAAAALAAPRVDQRAWAFILQGGYRWKEAPWTPRLALIVSTGSGDRDATDQQSGTFLNLLPSNHGLYGAMDLSGLQNIRDYRISLSAKPNARTSIALDFHQQYLTSTHDYWYNVAGVPRSTPGATPGSGRGFGINPDYSSDLGREVDLIGGWSAAPGLLLEAGVGRFFRGDYVKQSLRAVGSKDSDYLFVQATLNF